MTHFPDVYYRMSHIDCYNFYQQCENYFATARATGPIQIFFAMSFLWDPDLFPLAVVQAKTRCTQLCSNHVEQVQSVSPLPPRWLTNFCGHLLGKDQKRHPVLASGSFWLGNPLRAPACNPPTVWPHCHSEWGDYDPILPKRSETFRPGPVKCPKPRLRLLRSGH